MALEWLVPMLVKAGIDLGVQSVQKWQQGRYLDLSNGRPGSNVTISVNVNRYLRLSLVRPDVVLLALEHENGWRHPLYAEPYEEFRIRVERGVYTISALVLSIPRDPDRKKVLLGLVRERHSIATAGRKQFTLTTTVPTADAVKRAGLVLPDGTVPFATLDTSLLRPLAAGSVIRSTRTARSTSTRSAASASVPPRLLTARKPPVGLERAKHEGTVVRPRAGAQEQFATPPKNAARGKGGKDKKGITKRQEPRERFAKEIEKRGFYLGPGAKHIYYHRNDAYPEDRRVVIRGSRVRFEKQIRYEWKLWQSYGLPDELKVALKVLDEPTRGFAKRSWIHTTS